MRKRLLAALLVLIMLVSIMPLAVSAVVQDSGTCGDDLTWVLDSDGTLTISGTGAMTDYGSPTSTPWYAYVNQIQAIVIGDGVTSIGSIAFYDCSSLTSVTIPSSVTSIGYCAFYYCTSLASVTIPSGVTYIGESAIGACSNLTAIEVDPNNANYCSQDGVLFNKDMTTLVACPAGKTGAYVIPASVTCIEDSAFEECTNLTSITIPSGVTTIGAYTFAGCNYLTSVTIPSSVTSIGASAFFNCFRLTSIDIPDSVTSIGMNAFFSCNYLTSVTIPSSVTYIGERAFGECYRLTAIEVDPDNANYCSQDGVLFNKNMTTLMGFPAGKTGAYVIPAGVTRIEGGAFYDCEKLTSVTIPDSVTYIGSDAFTLCISLTSVTIPDSVTDICLNAFFYCTSLTTVIFEGDAPAIDSLAFSGVAATAYYPTGSSTWTEDVMQNYGGTITWVSYTPSEPIDPDDEECTTHSFVYNDATYHKCEICGTTEVHTDANGDCLCDVCGHAFHDYASLYTDENGHGYICGTCGEIVDYEAHYDNYTYHYSAAGDTSEEGSDGVCDACGYGCTHPDYYRMGNTYYGEYCRCEGYCTTCGDFIGFVGVDADGDGVCDVCGGIMWDSGTVTTNTSGAVASSITVDTSALLTEDDTMLIIEGFDVEIVLSVDEVTSSVSSTDSALILSAAGDDVTAVSYLDIDLTKMTYDTNGDIYDQEALTNLNTTVTITVAIPQTLLDAVGTATGTYSVVRVHDGVATVLATSYNSTAQTVTFATDRFSTYGIVFTGSTNTNNTNTGLDDVPQTGDGSLILVGIALMMAALPAVKKFVF